MSYRDNDEPPVEVELYVLGGRTDRAIRVCQLHPGPGQVPDDDTETWLPWSQIEGIEDEDGPVDEDELDEDVVATFTVTHWIAEREGWA